MLGPGPDGRSVPAGGMRQFLRSLLDLTPVTANLWRYWRVYPRTIAACRGVYPSWAAARDGAQGRHRIAGGTGVLTFRAPEGRRIHSLRDRDYPILMHLAPLLRPGLRILNPGGSLAKEYAGYRSLVPFPEHVDWRIVEVPEVVEAGQALLAAGDHPGLSFTTEATGTADIFLICGALQYLEPDLPAVLRGLDALPDHVFLSRTPMQSAVPRFYTVQNNGQRAMPYRIENEGDFIAAMEALGYRLVDAWRDDRDLVIPYYPQGRVRGYLGCYFTRAGGDRTVA